MKKWSDVTADPRYQSAAPELQERIRNDFFTNVIAPDIPEDVDASEIRRQFDLKTDPMLEKPTFLGAVKDRALENRKLGLDMIDSVFGEEKSVVAGKGMDNTPAIERRGGPLSAEGFAKVKGTFENADAASRDSLTNRPGAIGNAARKVDESYQQADAKAPNRVTDRRIESREQRLLQDGLAPETARAVSAQGGDVNTISKITPGIPDREIVDYALDTVRDVAKIAPQTGKMVIDTARLSGEYIPIVGDILTRASAEASAAIEEIAKRQSPELQAKSRELQMMMQTGDRAQVTAFLAKNPSVMSSIAIPSAGSMLVAAGPGIALRAIGASAEAATTATVASNALMNAGSAFSEAQGDPVARYTAALIAGGGTLLIGRLTEGGAEGAIARGLSGGGKSVASRLSEGAKIAGREYVQEFVEGGSEATGTQVADVMSGTRDSINPQQILNQAQVEGAAGLLLGGGVGMLQTMQQDQKQQATEEAKAALDAIPNANTVDEAIALFNETIKAPITVNTPPLFQEPITNAVPAEAIDAAELVDGLPAEGEPDVSLANDITPVPAGVSGLESDLGTGSVGDRLNEQPGDAAALDGSIRPDEPVLRNGSGDAAVTFANAQEGQIVESGGQQFRKVGNGFERVDTSIEQSTPVESQIQPDMNVNEAPNITRAQVAPEQDQSADLDVDPVSTEPQASQQIIEVKDRYGRTHRVRQSDLDGTSDRLPTIRKNGDVVSGEEIPRSIIASNTNQEQKPAPQLAPVAEKPSQDAIESRNIAPSSATNQDLSTTQQIAYIGSKNSKQVLTAEPFGTDGKHLAVKLNGDFIYDFESGDEVTVPVDATLDDIKKAIKKSGQFNGKTIITYNKGYAPQAGLSQPGEAPQTRWPVPKRGGFSSDAQHQGAVAAVEFQNGDIDKAELIARLGSLGLEEAVVEAVTYRLQDDWTAADTRAVMANGTADKEDARKAEIEIARSNRAKAMIAERMKLNPTTDTIFEAMAKLGGLKKDDAVSEFGLDPADLGKYRSGILFSFTNGKRALTPDGMREALAQYGYDVGDTVAEFGDKLDNAIRGIQQERTQEDAVTEKIKAFEESQQEYSEAYDALSEADQETVDQIVDAAIAAIGDAQVSVIMAEVATENPGESVNTAFFRTQLKERINDHIAAQEARKQAGANAETEAGRTAENRGGESGVSPDDRQEEVAGNYLGIERSYSDAQDTLVTKPAGSWVYLIEGDGAFDSQPRYQVLFSIGGGKLTGGNAADTKAQAFAYGIKRVSDFPGLSLKPEAGADLFGDNTATRQSIADAARAKDTKRNSGESNPVDFTLTGSDRAADQAIARGAQDLFGSASAQQSTIEKSRATKERRNAALAVLGEGWKASDGADGARDIFKKRAGRFEVSVMPEKSADGNFTIGGYRHGGKRPGAVGQWFANTIEDAARIANDLVTKEIGSDAFSGKADATWSDALANRNMANYHDLLKQQDKDSFERGFKLAIDGKPLPKEAIENRALDDGYLTGARWGDGRAETELADLEVSKAKEALNAAGVTGTDKLNTIAQVRDGKLTAEEVAEAHGLDSGNKAPWQMTRTEWDKAREAVRPNVAQSNFTRASGSEAASNAQKLEDLLYGVHDADSKRIKAAQDGEIKLSPDEVEEISDRLNTRVSHEDVVRKAISEGKQVPKEVLADYPDLSTSGPEDTFAQKIEDFGEKIAGAKKEKWQTYQKAMSDELPADAKDITLSKNFPEPDYENLIANGTPIEAIALVKAMRDEIPAKPRKSYKLQRWVDQLRLLRDFSNAIINGAHDIGYVMGTLSRNGNLSEIADRAKLYAELGYPAFKAADGYAVSGGWKTLNPETDKYDIEKVGLRDSRGRVSFFDTRAQAIDALRARLETAPEGGRSTKLDIYRVTKTGDIVIGKKVGAGKFIDLKPGFKTGREANQYLKEHEQELLELLAKKKEVRPERRSVNNPRVGEDYRMGEDVTPEKFASEFGFRGVQFGNYVEQKRRPMDMNNAYDALLDMSNIIGVPSRALSLNGSLGLAFGARGSGGVTPAAAHFEPDEVVINLTKMNGAGSLGHEWFHAMDNYFSRMARDAHGFITEKIARPVDNVRPEVMKAFADVVTAIKGSEFYKDSRKLDGRRSKDYWGTTIELGARAFESYLIDKAAENGESNDYLANIVSEESHRQMNAAGRDLGMEDEPYPYPTKADKEKINPAFDKLFETLKTKETEQGVALFSRASSAQTATAEFKRWFGDSKVVDAEGKPLVVYHGTRFDFEDFDTSDKPAWFSETSDLANERYAFGESADAGANVMPVYLSLKNPMVLDADMDDAGTDGKPLHESVNNWEYRRELESRGYDGIIVNEDGRKTFAAFRPEQIKSAIGNRGTFDPSNPDILLARGDTQPSGITLDKFKQELATSFGEKTAEKLIASGVIVPLKDQSQLPAHVVPFLRTGDIVFGFYDPKTNRTYAVLENLTPDMIKGLTLHEVGTHYGFKKMLGEAKYQEVMNRLDTLRRAGSKEIKKAHAEASANAVNEKQVPEETLAYLVQNHPTMSIIKDVIARIKAFLFREFGIAGKYLNEDDLTMLAKAAVNYAAWHEQQGSIESRSQKMQAAFQRVWHGSPHIFDKFSLDAIGTGEGAQAYGWGLYFSGNKSVAEYYRKMLGTTKYLSENQFNADGTPNRVNQAAFQIDAGVSRDEILDGLEVLGHSAGEARTILREAQKLFNDMESHAGQLYEVEIPEEDTFLLWDKPLNEQPEKVKAAIIAADLAHPDSLEPNPARVSGTTGKDLYEGLARKMQKLEPAPSWTSVSSDSDGRAWSGQEAASKNLHSLGINGIKYLDGTSRSAGDGSYNYVVFDDNAADIVQTHYSRDNRQPSSASGDTIVTAAMEYLARDPELFQRPLTEVKDIYGIAKEIDPGYRVERLGPSMTKERKADRAWEVFVPGSNVRSGVIMANYEEVWIDVSRLQSGIDSGSAIYDMAAAYAHNNGKVLIGDPLGLSRMAYYRRNENMLSSALKYGTTRHLRPHLAQEIPSEYFTGHEKAFGESVRPLNWIEGDDVNNIREMIYNSWKAAIDNVPELKDVIYDPATQQFQYVDGRPFTDQDSERIAAELSRASRPYRAGSATQKRAALFNTFLRSEGREGRKQVLGALVDQLSRAGLSPALKGVFYSRSNRTQTPEFKKWFGDSKVIDANGNPLVVYHGTGAKFDAFVKSDGGTFGDGIYLTKSKEAAQEYADTVGGESNVMELYVSIKNPAPEDIASNVESRFGPGTSSELRRMGYDGIMAGDDIVAFRPEQIKSAIGNNGDFDGNNSNILFSRQGSFNPSWDAPEPSKFDNLIYTLQDKNIDLKRVTQEIQKAGNEIDDRWNAYLQEELYHGRTAKRTQDFIREELDPLVADMQARKVTMADFEEYLWMRHAEERNEQIAKVNPEMPDSGSGVSTAEAQEYLDSLSEDKRADFEALAARIDAINGKSRQLLIDYGLESRSTIKAWQDTYQHYVPLMREEMDHGFGNGTGQGFSVRGNSAKRATGSKRAVVDILANIAMQREKNIIRGEKNRVATALIGLAKLNPNPEFWNTDTVPQIKDIGKDGLVTYRPDPNYKGRENVIVARIVNKQGKIVEHSVIFNQFDERAQRMAASLKNLDQDQIGELLGVASSFTRYFASINTQYNPVFGAINITRDVQGALFNLESTPLAGKQKEVTRLTGSALKGIYQEIRAVRKGKKAETKWAQLWEEFQKEGGKTGFRDMYRNAKMRGEALEHAIDPEWWQKEKWGRVVSVGGVLAAPQQWLVSKPGKALFDWLSDYNDTLENSVRLAAYKVALDQGLSKQQSASIAKNLTVNFNRKGEMGRQIGSLYAFFNASVQGTARIGETLFKEGKMTRAGKQIIGGGMLLGGMQALMLAFAGYDDDEPPEFVRDRNLVIPLDWINDLGGPDLDDKYFTIPMPLGYNAIPATGRILTEWAMDGFDNTQHRFAHLLEVYMDMFNPIGYSGISMQTLAPTALDPFAALAENKDWTGMPIAREDFSSLNPTPGFTRSKDTASSISKGMSYSLNWLTGGTDYTPGIFSPTPDQIDYLIGQFTGGVGREYMKLEQTASSMVTGDELPTYKIPLVGRFYGNASGQTAQGGKFYDNLIRMNKHSNEIKGRMENGGDVDAYLAENPEAELADYATSTYSAISKLRKQRNQAKEEGSSKSELKEIDQDITDLMREFNDEVRKIKDGAPA